jgi:hypothetical protein
MPMLLFDRSRDHRGLCQIARQAREDSVKFEPEMKKNGAIAASASAPWVWTNSVMRNKDRDVVCRGAPFSPRRQGR